MASPLLPARWQREPAYFPEVKSLNLSDPFQAEPIVSTRAVAAVSPLPVTARKLSVGATAGRCPSCLALQTPDSVWCRLCGHRLAEVPDGISDGVRIRALEAELESLRALHLEEVLGLQEALEKRRKEQEVLRLELEARQKMQHAGDQTLDQSLQQQRSLHETIANQEQSLKRFSTQVEDLSQQLAVSRRENELMRADLEKQRLELQEQLRRHSQLSQSEASRASQLMKEDFQKQSAELQALLKRNQELEKLASEHKSAADSHAGRAQLLQSGYESRIHEHKSDFEGRLQEQHSAHERPGGLG
ncbi:unnamed protein product [Durusdinium trenchii]|uniref:Uncharacterized protein n=1 Tax=Durusdinium trenchii TaxID=1381693 RepID=A0ABP0MW38_9DINO